MQGILAASAEADLAERLFLAQERARRAPQYVYDYRATGGWVALDANGTRRPPPRWSSDAATGEIEESVLL